MKYNMSLDDSGEYIKIDLSGYLSLEALQEKSTELLEYCLQNDKRKIFVDATNQNGMLSVLERFKMGTYLEQMWKKKIKIAVLVNESSLQEHMFFENVARNRGLMISMFIDEIKALDWLNRRTGLTIYD